MAMKLVSGRVFRFSTAVALGCSSMLLGCGSNSTQKEAVTANAGSADASGGSGTNGGSGSDATGGTSASNGGSGNGAGSSSGPMAKGVIITPKNGKVAPSGKLQFSAVVTGLSDNSVKWSVQEGDDGGTVGADGLYTAPAVSGTFHVNVQSTVDQTFKDSTVVTVAAAAGTPPVIKPGTFAQITPPGVNLDPSGSNAGVVTVAIDPSNPRTIYTGVDVYAGDQWHGIWKSTDGGSSWKHLGDGKTPVQYTNQTDVLDSCTNIAVDPTDSDHLYVTQGVRGSTVGFWVSHDGGLNWTRPQGFMDVFGVADVTAMAVDPSDFKHVILGSHAYDPVGILETKDGGTSWVKHPAPSGWAGGSYSVLMLWDPETKQGDANTWLVSNNDQFWRTTDAGANWQQVGATHSVHGFTEKYYAKDGTLWVGSAGCPFRSKDNGVTWEEVKDAGLACNGYQAVVGDGTNLYTLLLTYYNGENPFFTAPEATGTGWVPYKSGAQKFPQGASAIRFDRANRIIYSANLVGGLWALQLD